MEESSVYGGRSGRPNPAYYDPSQRPAWPAQPYPQGELVKLGHQRTDRQQHPRRYTALRNLTTGELIWNFLDYVYACLFMVLSFKEKEVLVQPRIQ